VVIEMKGTSSIGDILDQIIVYFINAIMGSQMAASLFIFAKNIMHACRRKKVVPINFSNTVDKKDLSDNGFSSDTMIWARKVSV
jgi:hypothetical protein